MLRSHGLARRCIPAIALLVLPSAADAHIGLRRSNPANRSRLSVAPSRISLWFTTRPQLGFSRIRLVGVGGNVALGAPSADTDNVIRAEIPGMLAPGDYTVHWQTASADGHPIRGELTFTVVGSGVGAIATPVSDTMHAHPEPQPEAHAGHSEYRTVRWIEFVALITLIGVLGFRHAVLPSLASRTVPTADAADRARRFGQNAIGLYAIAATVRLYTESSAVHGAQGALHPVNLTLLVTGTTWGIGWSVGVVGAIMLLTGWRLSKRHVSIGTPLALAGGVGIAASPALSGHAASGSPLLLSLALDVTHVAAAGVWMGGLLMVLLAGIPAMRRLANGTGDVAIASLVSSFHPIALFCAPIVVMSGVGTSWLRLGEAQALWTTDYGRTLLIKVGLFVLVALIGAHNWLRARRRLGSTAGTFHIRRTATLELALVSLVLAATTALVITPVPKDMLP